MSRHEISIERGKWVVGWDQPLMSFYLQFYDDLAEDDDNPTIWLGATADTTMYDIEDISRVASKNGLRLGSQMLTTLYNDRDEGK